MKNNSQELQDNGPMVSRKKVANGLIWTASRNYGNQIITFIFFIILSRILEPEAFGLVALAAVFTDFVNIFIDLGLGDAIVQRENLTREHIDTVFWTGILFGILMMMIGILFSPLIARFFSEPQLTSIIRWLSLGFLIGALSSTQKALLRRHLEFRNLAIRDIVATIIGGIVGVSLAFSGYGVWSLVAQTLVAGLMGAIILWRVSDWRPGLRFSGKNFGELFSFGANILGIKTLDFLNKRSDDFLIGYFLGATLLGYYTIAYRLLLVSIKLLTGITTAVVYPVFSRLQNSPDKMRRGFYKVTHYTSLIAFPAFFGMIVLAPELMTTFFGEQWIPSIPVMQILAFIGILQSVSLFNAPVIKASGKPSWWLGIMTLTAVCNTIGFLIAVQWGITAVAASFVIVGYLLAPVGLFAINRLIGINYKTYLTPFIVPLFASLLMVVIVMGLKYLIPQQLNEYIRLAIFVVAGVSTYLLVIRLTKRSLFQQVFEIIKLVLPDWKLKGVS